MKKNIEKREIKRYQVSEYVKEDFYRDIHIEINTDKPYRADVTDISMNGIGFVIVDVMDSNDIDEINALDNYYIKIYFMNEVILAEVKKIWSVISEEKKKEKEILKCGLAYTVLSPEDRLNLAKIIETIRKRK